MKSGRPYSAVNQIRAGCEQCRKNWEGANAQAVAAKHYDVTGHLTWVKVYSEITYGATSRKEEVKKEEAPVLFK